MLNKELQSKLEIIANHYKYENQAQQTYEEMAELMVAMNKLRRYGKNQRQTRINGVMTELADVIIMANQIAYLLGCQKEVEKEIEYKINRAIRNIEKEESK